MSLATTLMAALALTSAGDTGWARFSARQALSHLNIDVEIGTQVTGGEEIYWMRRTIQKPGRKTQISQVDARSCPTMLASVRSLRDLPMPRPNVPLLNDEPINVTADGTGYSLTIPVAYPGAIPHDLTLTSNVGTPLALSLIHI